MHNLKNPALFRQQAYINGQWIDADDGARTEITNPANGTVIGTVPQMGAGETQRAIDAAAAAWPAWRAMTAKERAVILRKWYELMLTHQDDLALLMTLEQGKPLAESRGEILYAANFLEWFAEEGKRTYGETIPPFARDRRVMVTREPIGVCAAITPWNFPSAMITRKVAPALAAGCPMVLKPAEATPYSALALVALAEQAGVPAGIFSVVTGKARAIGAEMTGNPVVRKLSFTGSTEVGRILMAQSAPTIKKLSLELGGNAPFIVFDDADIPAAVAGAMASKYRNNGQTCVCANRIYVQRGIHDAFVSAFSVAVAALKVGDGLEPGVQQGPLIDASALEKVQDHIQDALSAGATLVLGGKPHALGGLFFEPTLITGVTSDMKVAREETFGPLAPIFTFDTEADIIHQANDTEYGLAAYFYSRDIGRIYRVAEALEYGMVGINTGILSTEVAPFGGVKQSGLGREGSRYGIDDYLVMKYWCIAGM